MLDLRQDHVLRARLRTPREDGARVRLAQATAGGLHPDGLASEAILVLKRVEVAWELDRADGRALRGAVAERLAHARRPGLSDDIDAVIFSSIEELLACLARDGVAGRQRWWWAALGADYRPALFVSRWLESPQALPGVVRILAAERAIEEVFRQLHTTEARALLRALVLHFRIDELVPGVEAMASTWRSPAVGGAAGVPTVPAPWVIPADAQVSGALPPPVEAVLGVAVLLATAPGVVRRRAFVVAWSRWVEATVSRPAQQVEVSFAREEVDVPAAPEAEPPPVVRIEVEAVGEDVAPSVPGAESEPPKVMPRVSVPDEAPSVPTTMAPRPLPAGARPAGAVDRPDEPLDLVDAVDGVPEVPTAEVVVARLQPAPEETPWVLPESFETALGGVFYLVNVLLHLELYGDFTQPARSEPEVPLWDVLAALAARCLVDPPRDALWGFLARLGGREALVDEPMAAGDFTPPGEGWVLSRELPPAFPRPLDASVEAWLDAVEGGVRARLTTAIELEPDAWLRQRARVRAQDHHLEVCFSLTSHPIEVRIAGLDRDPGWVPAAGRDLRFRYDP